MPEERERRGTEGVEWGRNISNSNSRRVLVVVVVVVVVVHVRGGREIEQDYLSSPHLLYSSANHGYRPPGARDLRMSFDWDTLSVEVVVVVSAGGGR